MKTITRLLALIGLLTAILFSTGIYLDYQDFDPSKGGYAPPYEGVTGERVDWGSMDLTATGLAHRGRIVNVLVDGTTGMISFEVFKQRFTFRKLSDRAIAVHKPREAFIKRGFNPEF